MRLTLLLLALTISTLARAQNDCDLGQVTDSTPLVYPPIARAAHVSGLVLLRVTFKPTGEADHIELISGPVMLQRSATQYVQGWKASSYPGIRSCPIAISYVIDASSAPSNIVKRVDAQHVIVTAIPPVLYAMEDPRGCPVGRWYRLRRYLHLLRDPCPSFH